MVLVTFCFKCGRVMEANENGTILYGVDASIRFHQQGSTIKPSKEKCERCLNKEKNNG